MDIQPLQAGLLSNLPCEGEIGLHPWFAGVPVTARAADAPGIVSLVAFVNPISDEGRVMAALRVISADRTSELAKKIISMYDKVTSEYAWKGRH